MPSKKILFVLTSHDKKGTAPSGFYLSEVTHPHKVLSDAGYAIEFVSPKGGKAPIDGFDLDDSLNAAFWHNAQLRAAVEHTQRPSEVDADAYAAIFYAGGHATMWDLPGNHELAGLAARIYERGGLVAAVCHGPSGLLNVKLSDGSYLVAGQEVAAFTNEEERAVELHDVVPFLLADELEARGATHSPAANFQAHVVVSGRLITGQNPASASGVGEAMLTALRR
jgi:putative intracellular protease/amidase